MTVKDFNMINGKYNGYIKTSYGLLKNYFFTDHYEIFTLETWYETYLKVNGNDNGFIEEVIDDISGLGKTVDIIKE